MFKFSIRHSTCKSCSQLGLLQSLIVACLLHAWLCPQENSMDCFYGLQNAPCVTMPQSQDRFHVNICKPLEGHIDKALRFAANRRRTHSLIIHAGTL